MKQICLTLLLVPLFLAGCARHYVLTLTSGSRVTAVGKPKLDGGAYVYKDVNGQTVTLAAGRVTEVAPASMAQKKTKSSFKSTPSR